MRLLIATPLYPPELGGPATYSQLLEKGLEEYGVEAPILVKFSVVREMPRLIRHVAYFWRVYREGRNADVLLALDPVSVGLPTLFAARLLRKPFLVKIVGDYAWEQGTQRFGIRQNLDQFVNQKIMPFPVSLLQAVQRHVARGAVKVIVPSSYLKGIVKTWGVSDERIQIIYNSVSLEEGGVPPSVLTDMLSPRIFSAGRLVAWKGMKELIWAVSMLDVPASLVIIGEGPERAGFEAYAEEQLGERCIFTGALPHSDLLASIKSADVFVLNSSYEGLSHVLIEALMLGKPVIATSAGGNSELITDGENGLLVPASNPSALAEAIARILQDPALASRLGDKARGAAARFSVESMLTQTTELLKSL